MPVNAGCLMLMAGACLLYGLSQHPAHVILSRAIAGLASGACMLPYVWILRMVRRPRQTLTDCRTPSKWVTTSPYMT